MVLKTYFDGIKTQNKIVVFIFKNNYCVFMFLSGV